MLQAHFENIRKEILGRLNDSKEEILIAMAWFTSAELFDALISCCNRGVKVRLILLDDAINWQPYAPDFNQLISAGANIQIANRDIGFLHHKFCVIDHQTVVTGSYNWTYYAEVRNIENVVISDDFMLASQYVEEYNRLKQKTNPTTECKRLAWSDIETEPDINFSELNVEIEEISKVRNLPKHEVLKTQVKVTPIEKDWEFYSNANIGILVYDRKNNQDKIIELIPKDTKLPYSKTLDPFYNYDDKRENISLKLFTNDGKNTHRLLVDEPLSELVGDNRDFELTIIITASLDTNGYLRVVSECKETGRSLDATTTDSRLVRYE